jgi:hypothetical protein
MKVCFSITEVQNNEIDNIFAQNSFFNSEEKLILNELKS